MGKSGARGRGKHIGDRRRVVEDGLGDLPVRMDYRSASATMSCGRASADDDAAALIERLCVDYRTSGARCAVIDIAIDSTRASVADSGNDESNVPHNATAAAKDDSESDSGVLDVPKHIGKGGKKSQRAENPANTKKNQKRAEQKADTRARVEARMADGPANIRQIHRDIKAFVAAGATGELPTEPQPPAVRAHIHDIARLYALKSRSRGKGIDRACVISADPRVAPRKTPVNVRSLDRAIDAGQRAADFAYKDGVGAFSKKGPNLRGSKKNGSAANSQTRPRVGEAVGAGAAPLDEDNVGNQMLRRLGWTPGSALGTDAAQKPVTEPVAAIFRAKERTGLGH